jgi:hypothetical protein
MKEVKESQRLDREMPVSRNAIDGSPVQQCERVGCFAHSASHPASPLLPRAENRRKRAKRQKRVRGERELQQTDRVGSCSLPKLMITTAIHMICFGIRSQILAVLVYLYHGAETVRVALNNLEFVSGNG